MVTILFSKFIQLPYFINSFFLSTRIIIQYLYSYVNPFSIFLPISLQTIYINAFVFLSHIEMFVFI